MEDKIILKFKTKNILNFYEIEPRSQQRSQFSTQNLVQMENVDTNWNLE